MTKKNKNKDQAQFDEWERPRDEDYRKRNKKKNFRKTRQRRINAKRSMLDS